MVFWGPDVLSVCKSPMKKILVVDDDERLLSLIIRVLEMSGFAATGVLSASIARSKIRNEHYDAVIVDWMMPNESGIAFIKAVRNSMDYQNKLPAIMLTAVNDTDHKIQGFEAGYDDYITKPFEPRELIARLNALIKRTSKLDNKKILIFGNCEFNTVNDMLKKNGAEVQLSTTELNLLKTLSQRPNEPFSRAELAKKLAFQVSDRTIDVQITRLRKKIGDNPKNPMIIKTIRYIGYALCSHSEVA